MTVRRCPRCAEDIAPNDVLCPHCGAALSPLEQESNARARSRHAVSSGKLPRPVVALACSVAFVIALLGGRWYRASRTIWGIVLGPYGTCIWTRTGATRCWGRGPFGPRLEGRREPVTQAVSLEGLGNVRALAFEDERGCGIDTKGTVRCWSSAAGSDDRSTRNVTPEEVAGLGDVEQVATGIGTTCARRADGTIWCWGWNDTGQLGDGTTRESRAPTQVQLPARAVEFDLGGGHACARLLDGTVACWGANSYGQLGLTTTRQCSVLTGEEPCSPTPVVVTGLTDVAQLAMAGPSTCALRRDGSVWCWGNNDRGQLGHPSTDRCRTVRATTPCSITPMAVENLPPAAHVALGGSRACAVLRTGSVMCWGDDEFSPEDHASRRPVRGSPVAVPGLGGAVHVSLGDYHSCVRTRDNDVLCWGLNDQGQLGDGTTAAQRTPVALRW